VLFTGSDQFVVSGFFFGLWSELFSHQTKDGGSSIWYVPIALAGGIGSSSVAHLGSSWSGALTVLSYRNAAFTGLQMRPR
jgi:hypothetical protein